MITEEDKKMWYEWVNSSLFIDVSKFSRVESLSKKLDLHGFSVHEAYDHTLNFIEEHYYSDSNNLTIVTGKSGQIYQEFPTWIKKLRFVRKYENKNGYYLIELKTRK